MTNAINANYLSQFQGAGLFGKNAATSNKFADTNSFANYANDATVEISAAGLSALEQMQNGNATDESKLSAKAQDYLAKLREKYGDYDFIISDDLDTSKTAGSSKEYSVLLTSEEIEKMAEDDDYAQGVMGKVGDAVDILKNLSKKDLGEGVQFSQLAVSFDSEGNMKLFAQLEKLSEDQAKRLEEAKEKRAEEKKVVENSDDDSKELIGIIFKSADVEADSAEELLNKIFGIDWSKIPDEEAYI